MQQHRNDLRAQYNQVIKMSKAPENSSEQVKERDKFNVEISDISATGIHFITSNEIEEGNKYIIELLVDKVIEKIVCKIVRVNFEGGKYDCGAKFEKMSYGTEKNIRAYVYRWEITRCR
ncbi:MAG TPA: hypothetical protein DEP72_07650 [Clostridiales bacterium]|nr:MAG: hypothetical protein A2Y18_06985 [Clostridiales bacterium GWD2_32_19]HCC08010.1 hypothetical protein [Clostridiales bacterium]